MALDQEFIAGIRGSSAFQGLAEIKWTMCVLQTGILMSLEGTTRAAASEIAERAQREYGIEFMPSKIGQCFALLGIRSVTTHGKNRFVLDPDELEKAKGSSQARYQTLEARLRESIEAFKGLAEKIKSLENQWRDVQRLRTRENELTRAIRENQDEINRLYGLRDRAGQLQETVKKAEAVETECKELEQRIQALPALNERKAKLQKAEVEYQKEVRDLEAKEQQHARMIESLKPRNGMVSLAAINEAIQRANEQLAAINRQIDSKRSFLDKLLGRKDGK
jgi:DNA repair exonuclease SbcCD ATPase subunit